MKKLLLLLLLLAGTAGQVLAQAAAPYRWVSPRYQVLTDESEESAREICGKMEAAFRLFSRHCRFAAAASPRPLQVRIFRDKPAFDEYLATIVSGTRRDFVLISYPDPARDELVGFRQEPDDFDASLLSQGFVQYLKSFIPGAPAWLQAGMAAYLERSEFDPSRGEYRFRPNHSWLPMLKGILRGESSDPRFSLEQLITMDREQASAHLEGFYAQSWGLVCFLIHSENREYNRVLWDALSALEASRSAAENSKRAWERAFAWLEEDTFRRDFESFVFSQYTFADRVRAGVDRYNAGRLEEAEAEFQAALKLDAGHPLPHYYLGLIRYASREYGLADEEYRLARQAGGEEALIHYAMGVNAFADRRYAEAEALLRKARELDPGRYAEMVDALLKRLELME